MKKQKQQLHIYFFGIFFAFLSLICTSQNLDSIIKKLPALSGKEKAQALCDLCYYISSSDIKQSLIYGNRAVAVAKEVNNQLLVASCENDLALSYFYQGNFDSCLFLANDAYKIRLANNKLRDAGASISKVALAYYEKGKYDISLEKNLIALDLFKKSKATIEAAKLENNIGSIYERNNQLDEAKKMYAASAENALLLKDYEGFVTSKCNYAIILQKQGHATESIKIYNELIQVSEKYCRKEYISQIYQSLGVAQRRLGNTAKGLEYYLKAKTIYDEIGSVSGSSVINIDIGNCYADLKKFKEADTYLKLGLKQAQDIKSLLWQKLAYFGLYDLERLRQDYKQANFYLENYQAVTDSLYNADTQDKLSNLQTQYNVQQKENTILAQNNTIANHALEINKRNTFLIILISAFALLILLVLFIVQRNNVRRKKSEIIFQGNIQKERSRISKDLHDNMGAELTIISSAIDIKASNIEKENDRHELEKISDQVRKASALMRDTIWTVSEEKISVMQFGIKIKEFADRTFNHKNIMVHFKNSTTEFNLRPETTLNLFRIVQEIINNASKHAGAANFYIENFVGEDRSILLWDDGAGFDMAAAERGYGLNNMMERARDLNATLEFDIKKGLGTKVKITLSNNSVWLS